MFLFMYLYLHLGIFRGRGDTKTPLLCTAFGSIINILLDPIFIFTLNMGCAGAGVATAISQWCTAIPLLYFLNRSTQFISYYTQPKELISNGTDNTSATAVALKVAAERALALQTALQMYIRAGGLIFIRTIAKVSAYAVTSAYAASLGTVSMAAYSLTFNLGFATSQLCEAFSVAAQALLARELPFNTKRKVHTVQHIIQRSLFLGLAVSGSLSIITKINLKNVLGTMAKSIAVQEAAAHIMPIVLITQLFKGLSYASGGILLGGRDWKWSTASMIISSIVCLSLVKILPLSLWNVWVSLAAFMAVQVVCALTRIFSRTGPWRHIQVIPSPSSSSI